MAFSLLGELDEDEDEDDEKPTPVRPGGLVAVFCPVRLLRQTGQLSCLRGQRRKELRGGGAGPGVRAKVNIRFMISLAHNQSLC